MAGNLRSPRKRALEIGVDKSKLVPDPDYDYQGGFPNGTPGQGGSYSDPASPPNGQTPGHNPKNPIK